VEPGLTNLRPFPGNYKKHKRTGRGPGAGSVSCSLYFCMLFAPLRELYSPRLPGEVLRSSLCTHK
jgi:hypothetical protein